MAATATRPSNTSPSSNSRMSSPKDSKKTITAVPKSEEKVEPTAQSQSATTEDSTNTDSKPATTTATTTTTAQPLGPPARPAQNNSSEQDYFNTIHNPFSLEPNVFEQSFSNPSLETPGGRPILPPVANITSPSPLPGITPGWQSLRAGPLSPAMLSGPAGQTDYFSESFRGFPTPNESSLRTGLTPGGGGSMFPAPSPNTAAALFNLQSGGVTPSTADFQQTSIRAAQANHIKSTTTSAPTSQPEVTSAAMDRPSTFAQAPQQPQQPQPQARPAQDMFGQHDVSTAANDLLSFATQSQQNGPRNGQQPFAMSNQTQPATTNGGHMPVQPVTHDQSRRNTKGSINSINMSIGSADTGDFSDSENEQNKAPTRARGNTKKGGNTKQAAGSRRKAEEATKGGNKKNKGNNGVARSVTAEEEDSDDGSQKGENGEGSKKMTDEEKRKNFLERNRVAALKCRQRKKQWLANLQAKVELFSTENDALSATVTQLREEIVNLKTLLLAHKDCPVAQAQGLQGMNMNTYLGEMGHHQNPYGMGMNPNMGMPMQPGTQIQNRYDSPLMNMPPQHLPRP